MVTLENLEPDTDYRVEVTPLYDFESKGIWGYLSLPGTPGTVEATTGWFLTNFASRVNILR